MQLVADQLQIHQSMKANGKQDANVRWTLISDVLPKLLLFKSGLTIGASVHPARLLAATDGHRLLTTPRKALNQIYLALVATTILIGTFASRSLHAAAVTDAPVLVEGSASYSLRDRSGNIHKLWNGRAKIHLESGRYALDWEQSDTPNELTKYVLGSDGQDTYGMNQLWPDPKASGMDATARKGQQLGFIGPAGFPHQAEPAIQSLWLAFVAASDYPDGASRGIPFSKQHEINHGSTDNFRIEVASRLRTSGAPELVKFWAPGSIVDDDTGRTKSLSPPYNNGFLSMTYEVLRTTNHGSRVIPISFELKGFARKPNAKNADDVQLSSHLAFEVEQIKDTITLQTCRPEIVGEAIVLDWRYQDQLFGQYLPYKITNQWMEADDPILAGMLARQTTAVIDQRGISMPMRRLVVLVLASMVAVTPLTFFLLRKWRRKSKQER